MKSLLIAVASLAVLPSSALAGEIAGRVVDASGNGVADAVVFVQEMPAGVESPAPPAAALDQVDKQFVPRVLPVVVGNPVTFPNHDQIHHHVYSFSRSKSFEIPLYKDEEAPPVLFDKLGAVKVGCNIHDWMSAVILVVPTPYFAVTAADGSFALSGLPAGSYSLVAWHEGSKTKSEETEKNVSVHDGREEVSFTLDVAARPPRPAVHGLRGFE